ncbi:MAG: 4-hydroxythreonine-4-phosphate dehydrogenase PdxA [Vampirovibrionales bacterium]|nr:4-hydroxythreonine-4-phosphate dehydrogenase PdxA [Vampirovibrionales bacterium]
MTPASVSQPLICLTPGDPTGVGPEIAAKFLATLGDRAFYTAADPASPSIVVVGDIRALNRAASALRLTLPSTAEGVSYEAIHPDKAPGEIAFLALQVAIERIAAEKRLHHPAALVTGPISKANLRAAGREASGHTEILQTLSRRYFETSGETHAEMLFIHDLFRMLLLTRHIPLRGVSDAITFERVAQACGTLCKWLQSSAGIAAPRLALMALNPHGREIDDREDRRAFDPARDWLWQRYGASLSEPLPADALFRDFQPQTPPYDAYIAAYHDQGLIPMKLVAGLSAVNVTLGLPFLRTSVSHGMASDIAGRGEANPASLAAAWRVAQDALTRAVSQADGEGFHGALPSSGQ